MFPTGPNTKQQDSKDPIGSKKTQDTTGIRNTLKIAHFETDCNKVEIFNTSWHLLRYLVSIAL